MDREALLAKLRALPWDPKEYWVVAGGAMVLYGLRERTHDIDLGCTTALADALEAQGHPYQITSDGKRWFKLGEELEIFENWLCDRTVRVEGVPVVSLRGLLEMKLALGREKDLRDAALIREALARREAGTIQKEENP